MGTNHINVVRAMHGIRPVAVGSVRQLWCKEFRGPFGIKVDDWIVQRRWSGGTLVEKNCHHFDLFNWFAGSTPRRVAAFGSIDLVYGADRFSVTPDVIDNAQVLVQYESGATAADIHAGYWAARVGMAAEDAVRNLSIEDIP